MKGFGIEIKNTLLDSKHIKHMGISIWLYMWLLDKMTSISEDGIGKILGGRSVKYEDVNSELKISRRTYQRWITLLTTSNYINTERKIDGLVISVNKAHKWFGKSINRDMPQMSHDTTKVAHQNDKSGTSTIYNTSNNTNTPEQSSDDNKIKFTKEGADIIKSFEFINPACKKYYNRPPQRQASDDLIKLYGFERVKMVIEKTLPKTNSIQFFPTITTPVQLQEKWATLESAIRRYQSEKSKLKSNVAF